MKIDMGQWDDLVYFVECLDKAHKNGQDRFICANIYNLKIWIDNLKESNKENGKENVK